MSIRVRNITKVYGEQKALDNVSFDVGGKEVVGFLGPNGAGKSTMMKIITCFIPQTEGDVNVCGYDVVEQSLEVRKNVGYLPEHNPLYLDMYVKEYLAFIGGLHFKGKQIRQRVDEMVEITGLGLEQHKKIGALSKGYRQRVGLAQALIHDPKVLILDEPTSGLDPNQLREIRNLIRRVGAEKSVMLSTHIMQEVEAMCDRVIIINRGKIVADKPASDLKEGLGKGQVVTIEFEAEISVDALQALPGISAIHSETTRRYRIESAAEADLRTVLFQFAVENKVTILTLQKEEIKLEEVFQQLTK
ncbi:MAG: gliding motility-associated ABC transporter ATP-binding subunit GldA [Flavobacteriales bacterium]|nr:gliding motility-associated ABC transporter ATP-binding subunit GldA [Flavobacteriales bacterium]MCB9448399.1 gliding motility-associated ABC transporter ATP-binding subunit GldA [Flavobacteriales bacterium]